MSQKIIPFLNKKNSLKVPVLFSMGPKPSKDGKIIDHGVLGSLEYEIYERGVIHIFDKSMRFKKDIYIFEDEIKKAKIDNMDDGEEYEIKGSGDNDHLVFSKIDGDIKISLKKKGFEALNTLKNILNKGKQKLGGSK
jgi:hypothetical protein